MVLLLRRAAVPLPALAAGSSGCVPQVIWPRWCAWLSGCAWLNVCARACMAVCVGCVGGRT